MPSPQNNYPKPGDLLEVQHPPSGEMFDENTLNWNIFRLDDDAMDQIEADCYQHHIFTENRKLMQPGSTMMLMHFFVQPEFIHFKPSDPVDNRIDALRGYVAYVMLDAQFWATDVFDSFEAFSLVYRVKEKT